MTTQTQTDADIIYPDDDGQPMSENTLQFQWITTIQGNLDGLFQDNDNVFVAGDLLWYPVQGRPDIRQAPDVLVVFGRPRVYRGSYIQFREANIAPQVVWEILSPGNTETEMDRKFGFYDRYGVEEYYVYDPDHNRLQGWQRVEGHLQPIESMHDWISPRLGITFDHSATELVMFHPDGQQFRTFTEVLASEKQERQHAQQQRQHAEQQRLLADQERQRADQERQRADQERQRADQERQRAEQTQLAKEEAERRAEQEQLRAEQVQSARMEAEHRADQARSAKEEAEGRAERLAERLRALGLDPTE